MAEANVIAQHKRHIVRDHRSQGITLYDWRHYLTVVQRKPGALRNGAPFTELPESFSQLQKILLNRQGGDREMADILALVMTHDETQVEKAIELAMQSERPSKQHVLNCLGRLSDAPKPQPLLPPPALQLVIEPLANTQRYDELREKRQ